MATVTKPLALDESIKTTEATPRNIADVLAEGLKGIEDALPPAYTEGDGIDISNNAISVDTTFAEASTRANIASGDSLSTIWGKIKKFFTDLKAVAFSGAAADVTYGSGSVKDALDDLNEAKIFYKDIPIAGLQLSNYYINVNTNVNPNEYTAIGISDVAGAWDENLIFRTNTENTLRVLNMRTATYTVPSIYAPIRVYFVKASNVSAIPLS